MSQPEFAFAETVDPAALSRTGRWRSNSARNQNAMTHDTYLEPARYDSCDMGGGSAKLRLRSMRPRRRRFASTETVGRAGRDDRKVSRAEGVSSLEMRKMRKRKRRKQEQEEDGTEWTIR